MIENLKLGTCVKNMDKQVLSQDEICVKSCGEMVGEVCAKGCMENYCPVQGMTLVKNSVADNSSIEAVVINDGNTITTLLYANKKSQDELKAVRETLNSYGLSKSEVVVFELILSGKKNAEILKDLFISKATLKTHLNNCYKKLPASYQQYKKRR